MRYRPVFDTRGDAHPAARKGEVDQVVDARVGTVLLKKPDSVYAGEKEIVE